MLTRGDWTQRPWCRGLDFCFGAVIVFWVVISVGCQTTADRHRQLHVDRDAIGSAIRLYDSLLNAGDAVGFSQLWFEDAVQIPPGERVVTGRAAILERAREQVGKVHGSRRSRMETLQVIGDVAVVRLSIAVTSYTMTGSVAFIAGAVRTYQGSGAEGWLLSLDIWNWTDSVVRAP